MNCLKLTSTLCFGALMLLGTACTPTENTTNNESTGDESTSSTSEPTTSSTMPPAETTTSSGSESMTMGDTSSSSSESSSTGPDTTATTMAMCGDPENQDDGAECDDATGCGCKSGKCYLIPLVGGFCGECVVDADCPDGGGCSVPNPFGPTGSTCNMGEPGAGCMSDDICVDPDNGACGTLLGIPNVFEVATCGECNEETPCTDPETPNCSPTLDVEAFSGTFECVADNTVANNTACNLTEDDMGNPVGNQACMSGFCGEAKVMSVVSVGICGECNGDMDCPNGMTCTDPTVNLDMGTLEGSVCQ
jgi:hypothetical protein